MADKRLRTRIWQHTVIFLTIIPSTFLQYVYRYPYRRDTTLTDLSVDVYENRHCAIQGVDYGNNGNLVFNCHKKLKGDINLMAAVGSPIPSDVRPVIGPFGRRGRPAIEFSQASYVGRYASDLLNLPFPVDFGIKVSIFQYTVNGGVLFCIVTKDQQRDFLVLEITRKNERNQTIILTYRNTNPSATYELKFDVPNFVRRWTIFSIAVRDREVWLFMNGCHIVSRLQLKKDRSGLQIDEDAVVYVGRAGWYSRKNAFFGLIFDLEILSNPDRVVPSCMAAVYDKTKATSGQSESKLRPGHAARDGNDVVKFAELANKTSAEVVHATEETKTSSLTPAEVTVTRSLSESKISSTVAAELKESTKGGTHAPEVRTTMPPMEVNSSKKATLLSATKSKMPSEVSYIRTLKPTPTKEPVNRDAKYSKIYSGTVRSGGFIVVGRNRTVRPVWFQLANASAATKPTENTNSVITTNTDSLEYHTERTSTDNAEGVPTPDTTRATSTKQRDNRENTPETTRAPPTHSTFEPSTIEVVTTSTPKAEENTTKPTSEPSTIEVVTTSTPKAEEKPTKPTSEPSTIEAVTTNTPKAEEKTTKPTSEPSTIEVVTTSTPTAEKNTTKPTSEPSTIEVVTTSSPTAEENTTKPTSEPSTIEVVSTSTPKAEEKTTKPTSEPSTIEVVTTSSPKVEEKTDSVEVSTRKPSTQERKDRETTPEETKAPTTKPTSESSIIEVVTTSTPKVEEKTDSVEVSTRKPSTQERKDRETTPEETKAPTTKPTSESSTIEVVSTSTPKVEEKTDSVEVSTRTPSTQERKDRETTPEETKVPTTQPTLEPTTLEDVLTMKFSGPVSSTEFPEYFTTSSLDSESTSSPFTSTSTESSDSVQTDAISHALGSVQTTVRPEAKAGTFTGSLSTKVSSATPMASMCGNEKGLKGNPGPVGPRGPSGVKGDRGFQGMKGQKGEEGVMGKPGFAGPPGPAGPEGPKGHKGDKGNIGLPGTRGMKGQSGRPGFDGVKGDQGEKGPKGAKGDGLSEYDMVGKILQVLSTQVEGCSAIPGTFPDILGRGPPAPHMDDIGGAGQAGPPGFHMAPRGASQGYGLPGSPSFKLTKKRVTCGGLAKAAKNETKENISLNSTKGEKGDIGPAGPRGIDGSPGTKGAKGDKGPAGLQGIDGSPGIKGAKGDIGPVGPPGSDGSPGIRGEKGEKGIKGKDGAVGLPGLMGIRGIPGKRGATGSSGIPGSPGIDGAKGRKGEKGEAGSFAAEGAKGEKGSAGVPGIVGPVGPRGEKGEQGLPGRNGINGTIGKAGSKGDQGEKGIGGERGPVGPKGLKGETGSIGVIGRKGSKGEPGIPGEIQFVKGLTGPRGPQGLQGPSGPVGPQGPPGPPGRVPKFSMKAISGPPGPKGLKGNRGKNGYGIKGATGNPGSKGEKGDTIVLPPPAPVKGEQGEKGEQGPKGNEGKPGSPGKARSPVITLANEDDMYNMFGMFEVGQMAILLTTDDVFIRTRTKWKQITGVAVGGPASNLAFEKANLVKTTNPPKVTTPSILKNIMLPVAGIFPKKPYLRLVALNQPMSGDLGGVPGADYHCFQQSYSSGALGTYRAFLSDKMQSIKNIIAEKYFHLPVVNLKGMQIFSSWNDPFNATSYAAFNPTIPIFSFDGKDIRNDARWRSQAIWHGSHANGESHSAGHNCRNWWRSKPFLKGIGSSISEYMPAMNEEQFACDNKLAVLCIQIEPERR